MIFNLKLKNNENLNSLIKEISKNCDIYYCSNSIFIYISEKDSKTAEKILKSLISTFYKNKDYTLFEVWDKSIQDYEQNIKEWMIEKKSLEELNKFERSNQQSLKEVNEMLIRFKDFIEKGGVNEEDGTKKSKEISKKGNEETKSKNRTRKPNNVKRNK